MKFEMPWPPKQVWPNFRQSHHWRSYAHHVKAQRKMAWGLALAAGICKNAINWRDGRWIDVSVHFFPPDRRRRDRDGMAGAAKSILDGLSDATGIDDQYFAPSYHFGEPVRGGKVVVEIT